MAPIRGYFVWGGGILLVLIPFFLFVALGWPTSPDSCTNINDEGRQVIPYIEGTRDLDLKHPDTCYCEAFEVEDVVSGKSGIRQMTNTLSNFYAIFTSLGLVLWIRCDRKKVLEGEAELKNTFWNPDSWVPELYVFAVLFLGLGSMFLHASLSSTVSWLDGMSMYVFTCFLPVYTVSRRIDLGPWFYVIYGGLVAIFTVLNVLPGMEDASTILVAIVVGLYAAAELFVKGYDIQKLGGLFWDGWLPWFRRLGDGLFARFWMWLPLLFWTLGLGSFIAASQFRSASQTGEDMCRPDSWFQPHGLLWHTLSGVMAIMLYFYWRGLRDNEMRQIAESSLN